MHTLVKTVTCPECGEILTLTPDEVEIASLLVCENCYTALEITSEDPVEVTVVDVDPEELDDFDEDEED